MILRRYCSFIEYNTPSTSEGKFFVHGTDIKLKRLSENVDTIVAADHPVI